MSCDRCGLQPQTETGPALEEAEGWAASGLTRRQFIERATAAAIGSMLVACTVKSPVAPALPTDPYDVTISDYPALDHVGGVAKVDLGGGAVAGVGRVGASDYVAYGLACTHQGTQVVVSGDGWYCQNHGAEFDTAGNAVRGPASSPLISLQTSYDPGTGVLTINGSSNVAPGTTGTGGDDGEDGGDD